MKDIFRSLLTATALGLTALALASCGPDQDKIDNLAAAEGVARNEPMPEVEPEPLPPPVVNLPGAPLPEDEIEASPRREPEPADDLAPDPEPAPPPAEPTPTEPRGSSG